MANSSYPVFDVTHWQRIGHEQMGTKRKFWCRSPDDGKAWLFKVGRSHAGEHWAEKIVGELAALLQIPCAKVELANCELESMVRRGTISLDFTNEKQYGSLVHGNELLQEKDPNYPADGPNFRVAQHSLDKIFAVQDQSFITIPKGFCLPSVVSSASDLFIGYLMLDALVGNTDRHHENWGIILRGTHNKARHAELAPSYDHASSLGRELSDERRAQKLDADEKVEGGNRSVARTQTVSGYLEKDEGHCRIFRVESDPRPLHTLEVFKTVYEQHPQPAIGWLDRREAVSLSAIADVVDRVSTGLMSDVSKKFAKRLVELNRNALISRKFQYA